MHLHSHVQRSLSASFLKRSRNAIKNSIMTDINQWRRGLPARARTPALDFVEHEHDTRSASVPPTPRRGVRPKLSSYFTQAGPGKTDPLIYEDVGSPLPSWDPGNPFPSPNADSLMESIMCRLMSNPYDPLEPRFNGMLLQIFEEFRNLKDEKESLKAQVELERDGRYADKEEVLSREAKFEEERMEWKAEVKRLELLLAKGKRGLAEVTKARQDSVIRRRRAQFADSSDEAGSRRKETIVEFLQKSKRYEDKAWSSQRGESAFLGFLLFAGRCCSFYFCVYLVNSRCCSTS